MDNQTLTETRPVIKGNNNRITLLLIFIIILLSLAGLYWIYLTQIKSSTQNIPQQSKLCDGVKIVFFPGGNESDPFARVVYNGAKAAQDTLGANVSYMWSDWDSNKMLSQFVDATSASPDAIAVMGHPGAVALGPLIDEAERKNIIVTMQNVDIPSVREKYTSNGFGYVGQSLYNAGMLVVSGVVRKYQPSQGTEAIVFGVDPNSDPSRYERTKGIIDGLKSNNITVHEITIPVDIQKNFATPATEKLISDSLAKFPNTKIIIVDHGALTAAMPSSLQKINVNPGTYIVAGFDLSADTVAGIKNGYIGLISDQQPYLQGFLPVLQACLTKKYKFAGLYIDTGVGLIDSSNVDAVSSLASQGIR